MRVFITGATGFLGYHIVLHCIQAGHQTICLRRSGSLDPFDAETDAQIRWITSDEADWTQQLQALQPEVLIHAAWGGVAAEGRRNPEIQHQNIELTKTILQAADFQQIIMLGSQDEYGQIDSCIDETFPCRPLSYYAQAKTACRQLLERTAEEKGMEWQWVRIFSVYGEKQAPNWLIPSVINKCLSGEKAMKTTPGEQTYSYLYAADFAEAIISMIGQKGKSGIYNLSSQHPIQLKELFLLIKRLTHSDITFEPSLPYRENQSMTILGDSSKFIKAFGNFEHTSLENGLRQLILNKKNSGK